MLATTLAFALSTLAVAQSTEGLFSYNGGYYLNLTTSNVQKGCYGVSASESVAYGCSTTNYLALSVDPETLVVNTSDHTYVTGLKMGRVVRYGWAYNSDNSMSIDAGTVTSTIDLTGTGFAFADPQGLVSNLSATTCLFATSVTDQKIVLVGNSTTEAADQCLLAPHCLFDDDSCIVEDDSVTQLVRVEGGALATSAAPTTSSASSTSTTSTTLKTTTASSSTTVKTTTTTTTTAKTTTSTKAAATTTKKKSGR
ncbi:hypothetical protein SAICODRAFT_29122 [Saitoella complicata NRRL Y-17804]|uniref:Hyphally-regulated cell wall protein N-terminal domain-containing protein n=1 Tax=Saitoella complicata (strain BCRC 22490 / CBS 7301 / JCM 7358 / NBRC 10748 / NRRL Y-17804) TaxID=698492 RepID=A0A0E9NK62_SAICN|nr:uncharacterized protein SAICODRAFT_29122 [Saitoella complicata NRRL Y-17804]ODQ54891.1 hypothetical protein SAICODRAFT_29122 [Saitoella complicata NRRL Y-17804]GAO49790.1 hypothetical protein G7K_3932-t1 [Saitoella complicata NRRL Y-17804]